MRATNRPAVGMSIAEALDRVAFSGAAARKWRHPWQTRASWSARLKSWVATLEPAFVNHESPVVGTTVAEQAETDRDFGVNPLTGKPFFSDPIFSRDTQAAGERSLDIPLYLRPSIPLRFRALGSDGLPQDAVPKFFLDRGVRRAARVDVTELGGNVDGGVAPADLRLLRACDLILHVPRQALTSQVTLEPGPATGFSNVKQILSVRSATPGDALRVVAGALTAAQSIDPLSGDYEEATFDELLISTVYLLSPRGTAAGSEPDGTWTAYVKHGLFWSISYVTPELRILGGDPGLPFIPPLAGGAAQLVINFLTASINDATQQALNILSAHSMAGQFWTATGGGHDAEFPLSQPAAIQGRTGLDKDGRLLARSRAAAALQNSEKLDPDFPFRALSFPLSLLAA